MEELQAILSERTAYSEPAVSRKLSLHEQSFFGKVDFDNENLPVYNVELCQFFLWQSYLLKNWHASFSFPQKHCSVYRQQRPYEWCDKDCMAVAVHFEFNTRKYDSRICNSGVFFKNLE